MMFNEPPKVIYLQYHGDQVGDGPVCSDDVTWCWHDIDECDIKYVIASELDALIAATGADNYDDAMTRVKMWARERTVKG